VGKAAKEGSEDRVSIKTMAYEGKPGNLPSSEAGKKG
jgi:hypothetical protein